MRLRLALTLASLAITPLTFAADGGCPYPQTVKFAGPNWESGMFTTEVLRLLVEKGYGCQTDSVPGNTVTLENALAQNDIQVTGEQWAGRSPAWRAAE